MNLNEFIQHHHKSHGEILARLDALSIDQSNHASAMLTALANQQTELTTLKELIMALPTQADLQAAIDSVNKEIDQLATDQAAAIAALQAAIAAAGTPIDVTPQIAALQAIQTRLTALDAADVAANPPKA